MSTTVTYKGNTLTTVDNQTKVLETKGTWLEDDITLVDETSGGSTQVVTVTEETLPDGGIAKHITAVDISDTTAQAADVAQGKYFYTAQGVKTEGTASGGGGGGVTPPEWVRPADFPDLSKMDVSSGDILYMTSYADEARGFCDFSVSCNTGGYTVEVGNISGSTFIAEDTYTYSSSDRCRLYYGSANGTYKVLRVTGAINSLSFSGAVAITIGDFKGYSSNEGIVDIVGKLSSCRSINFQNKYNLVNVEISDLVLTGNRSNMFSSCTSLISVDVSGWDTSGVTEMSYMFSGCASLTAIDVSGWNTSSVTNMTYMFNNCSSLTAIDVSGWNTSSVTNMSFMFGNCLSLTTIDVSKWNTSSVTNMSSMFSCCYSLTAIDVSGWDISSVTTMSSMFNGCACLTTIDVSGWGISSTTNMSYMFSNCYSLTAVDVSGWNTSSVTTMSSIFQGCRSLTAIDVSKWNTSSVTNMSNMFSGCTSLISVDVSEWNTSSVTSMSSMFQGCASLILVDVSGFNTSGVTNMSSMFSGCSSLTAIDVSGFNTSGVTNMSNMFNGCACLTAIDVSEWDTSSVTNMSYMFSTCYSLTAIDISGWNFAKVTSASSAQSVFNNCVGLHGSITIPASATVFGTSCFAYCNSLYEFHFLSTTPPTLASTNVFSNMTDYDGKKIYVPVGSGNAYKTASKWSTWADYIYEEGE